MRAPSHDNFDPAALTVIALGVLYAANLIAVHVFGELEFWFALIKVATIVAILVIGLVVILFGVDELGQSACCPGDRVQDRRQPVRAGIERIGIPAAAGIINFVVITAAASSCNSGIFSTGRMLYTLAQIHQTLGGVCQGERPATSRRRRSTSRRR